jgi:Pyridine nucleotide-disulphide oxidoreductase
MQRILVLGAGFAGLWSAVAAARTLDELGAAPGEVEVLVVNRTAWHSIRVRNYEADLDETLVPLADVLDPIGVKHIVAEVTDINVSERKVACTMDGALQALTYNRLVFALGSRLARPAMPGLETHAFNVDTFEAATRLNDHIGALPVHSAGSRKPASLTSRSQSRLHRRILTERRRRAMKFPQNRPFTPSTATPSRFHTSSTHSGHQIRPFVLCRMGRPPSRAKTTEDDTDVA